VLVNVRGGNEVIQAAPAIYVNSMDKQQMSLFALWQCQYQAQGKGGGQR